MSYYQEHEKFHVAVDSIIFGYDEGGRELKVLLLKRNFQPAMGEWSLMGGFLKDNEAVDEAAKRILHQLTGLSEVYMEQLYTFGEVDRDPGARIISVAYFALIKINASRQGATGITGSGAVCILSFRAKAAGASDLVITQPRALNSAQKALPAQGSQISIQVK